MWNIGNIKIDGQVVLGPMAGYTNIAFRTFNKPFGVAVSYTEMVSDCGLVYQNKETYKYLETDENEGPVGIQLFGASKETLLKALKIVEEGQYKYDFIDVNLGCPVPKVTKTGAGSAWLKRKDELFDMMKALVENSKTPVTAKIRLGWDNNSINFSEVVELLQNAGVAMIAIHARTREELYTGKAHHEMLIGLKEKMSIPLVVSGDIYTLEDAIRVKEMTNADAIMVARGALGNPYLITQIDHYFKTGEKLPPVSLKQNIEYLKKHYQLLKSLKGEFIAIKEMRGIAPFYLKGYPNTKNLRIKLSTSINDEKEFYEIIDNI